MKSYRLQILFAASLVISVTHLAAQTLFVPDTNGISTVAGKIGIGTNAPNAKLQIVGDLYVSVPSGNQLIRAFGPTTGFQFTDEGSYVYFRPYHAVVGDKPLQIGPGPGGLRVDVNGYIGIGTTAPSRRLSVQSQYAEAVLKSSAASGAAGGSTLYFGNVSSDSAGWLNYDHTNNSFSVRVNEAERFRVDSAGNIGIGTTSPAGRLSVVSTGGQAGLHINASGNADTPALTYENSWMTGTKWVTAIGYENQQLFLGTKSVGSAQYAFVLTNSGAVGIGTTNVGSSKLAVNGAIRAKEVIVDTGWSDYVFAEGYKLPALSEVEQHIREHQHLPGIPSASEVAEHGISVGEMQAKLLAKIEELTLYMIQVKNENAALRVEVEALKRAPR